MAANLFLRKVTVDIVSPYGYVPTEFVTIIFLVLFGISTGKKLVHSTQLMFTWCPLALHSGQAIFFKTWWAFPTIVVAGLLELMGWSARLWSSLNPNLLAPYEMQLTCTILAPTPFVAGNFLILGRIINRLGTKYSRLPPRWYSIIFCSCDLISLLIQAIGGGTAATAVGNGNDPTNGGNIMLGGIVFQMATITVYVFCAFEFFIRYLTDTPLRGRDSSNEKTTQSSSDNGSTTSTTIEPEAHAKSDNIKQGLMNVKLKVITAALIFSTVCLFIRAVYRTIELSDGWSGKIIQTQVYFNVLDGTMIVLAMYTMNIAHPGFMLADNSQLASTPKFS
ncbi:RTA1 like protein-domain-containing protein [Rhodocollybia butyracea]|uniref:RTA1 like protein-domain-containing protein n=1 Tax=Rhodocollybia butyracea TaxID=206335 RepID=A0A9P5Q5X2_9AGAR|nr:RTA1 like protein-domain-containing protein [Rhodocollybia butyracea]